MRIYYEKKEKPVTAGEILALHRLAKEGKLNALRSGAWLQPLHDPQYVFRVTPLHLAFLLDCEHRRADGGPCGDCLCREIERSDLAEETKEQAMEAEDP